MKKLEMLKLQLEAAKETVKMLEEMIKAETPKNDYRITIAWSENNGFKNDETFTGEEINEVNERFAILNSQVYSKQNYGYDKTKFFILKDSDPSFRYVGRYDLGDYPGHFTLEQHIKGHLNNMMAFDPKCKEDCEAWLEIIEELFN